MRIAKSEQEKKMLWPVGFSNADIAQAGTNILVFLESNRSTHCHGCVLNIVIQLCRQHSFVHTAPAGGAATASEIPTPADAIIRRSSVPSQVVAVLRFDNPATAPVVRCVFFMSHWCSRREHHLLRASMPGWPRLPLI